MSLIPTLRTGESKCSDAAKTEEGSNIPTRRHFVQHLSLSLSPPHMSLTSQKLVSAGHTPEEVEALMCVSIDTRGLCGPGEVLGDSGPL